jgi:hypothetical protein
MLACIFALTACSSQSNEKCTFSYDEATITSAAEEILQNWNQNDFSKIDETQATPDQVKMYREWTELKNSIGDYKSVTNKKIVENGDRVTVVLTAEYSKDFIDFSVGFNRYSQAFEVKVARTLSSGEQMQKTISDAFHSSNIIYLVIIVILAIIVFIKCFPSIFGKSENESTVDNVIASIVDKENVNLIDNKELVAVITAAIMASMGDAAPAEGLVVRSIKRRSTNKWNKA